MTTTTIISCSGAGQAWVRNSTDDGWVCPECLLTPKELEIRVRETNKGLSPKTIPSHDVEVDGSEVKFVLTSDDFQVHSPTCPQIKRDLKDSDYERAGTLVAVDRRDVVMQLWDDQIREADMKDNENPTAEELAPYENATHFHTRCMNKVMPAPGAAKDGSAAIKREAKKLLADKVVAAIAAALADENDDNKRIVSQWIHHLPVHRELWPATLPKPERSDWVEDEPAEQATEQDEPETEPQGDAETAAA